MGNGDERLESLAFARERQQRALADLDTLLDRRSQLEALLAPFREDERVVIGAKQDASKLLQQVGGTEALASSIARKVRELDMAQSRLRATLERVDLVLELKNTIQTVQSAVDDERFEPAAVALHRMLKPMRRRRRQMDANEGVLEEEDVSRRRAAEDDESLQLLMDLEDELRAKIVRACEQARSSTPVDEQGVMRYSRLYALVGQPIQGLDIYCSVLLSQLDRELNGAHATLDSQPHGAIVDHLELLSRGFDTISQFVQTHVGDLEHLFGVGTQLRLIQHVQRSADRISKPLLDDFFRVHAVDTLLATISREQRQNPQIIKLEVIEVKGSPSKGASQTSPESKWISTHDLDAQLQLYAAIVRECELFDNDVRQAATSFTSALQHDNADTWHTLTQSATDDVGSQLMHVSKLNETVQRLLGVYVAGEQHLMLRNAFRAVQLDTIDNEGLKNAAIVSSMVDECFFVLKKSASRALSTSSATSACALFNHVYHFVSGAFEELLTNRLRRALEDLALGCETSIMSVSSSSNDNLLNQRRRRLHVELNNIETSSRYVLMLRSQLAQQCDDELLTGQDDSHRPMIEHCLGELSNAGKSLKKLLNRGLSRFAKTLQMRLIPLVDGFKHDSYAMDDAEFAARENATNGDENGIGGSNGFAASLIVQLEKDVAVLKSSLTDHNLEATLHLLAAFVAKRIESHVLDADFTFWGGLQLDRDVRSLLAFFAIYSTKSVLDKLSRLAQIATILQLESVDEILDYWGNTATSAGVTDVDALGNNRNSVLLTGSADAVDDGGCVGVNPEGHWRLTAEEVKRTLTRRVDFSAQAIAELQL